ncbi:hypothetical protein [Streptomyces malaysiensis]|uniref:hypothetical protein n=1 Tax=Streptomyces malaysiensis TaxID=92644 RepID=UPI00372426BF
MQSGKTERDMALSALRKRLEDGLARARLTKAQLAARASLGRTTVQMAFQSGGPVPSAATVTALAQALQLPQSELLELRRDVVEAGSTRETGTGLGQPIEQWNPHDLEVHPAGPASIRPGSKPVAERVLPGYVVRPHDLVLAEIVQNASNGSSELAILVGSSSTGKTRACWEAVQPLADEGWRLWHPFDPTRAEAALADLIQVGTRTVIWFNEAQHYLNTPQLGERIAAAVHQLLTEPARAPVLVLGTLWPEYARQLTVQPAPKAPDPHSRARELLAGRTVNVPEAFDREALSKATILAERGDRLLADALTRTGADGRMTQDLAGAPELLHRYRQGTPAAQAVLNAAMDARRLGVSLYLPKAFLTDAAIDYLSDPDYDQLPEDWSELVYSELAEPVHGKQAPLRRAGHRPRSRPPGKLDPATVSRTAAAGSGPMLQLADYLEQHGRTSRHLFCPPASFWHAAHAHLVRADDLNNLAHAAQDRHRLQWAHHLRRRAAAAGSVHALVQLGKLAQTTGDRNSAEAFYKQATDAGDTAAMLRLAKLRGKPTDRDSMVLYQQAADAGDVSAMVQLAKARQQYGDTEGAETLYQRAAKSGDTSALVGLVGLWYQRGDTKSADALYQQVADAGGAKALLQLAEAQEQKGNVHSAGVLYRQAADYGDPKALTQLARARERHGDLDGAQALYQQAADNGDPKALTQLARARERHGDLKGAQALYQQAADNGDPKALTQLVILREHRGDLESAETLARQAAESDAAEGLMLLAQFRERNGDENSAENLYQEAVNAGNTAAMAQLAQLWEKRGDTQTAEMLVQRAASAGHTAALTQLAHLREGLGNLISADDLYRQAADCGRPVYTVSLRRWPWGLDPDGTPTLPWEEEPWQQTRSTE